jgi:acyl-CoA-binding protein
MNSERASINTKVKKRTKRDIYELKMTTQNIKEELNKDRENLRKKNQTEILETVSLFKQKPVGDHSSRKEQVEDRISVLKDEVEIKEKKQRKS